MPQVDLIEESFVAAPVDRVAAVISDRTRWSGWWPDLTLSVFQDRGQQGVRWTVSGALSGSMEVWLEPHADGVLVHHYLRADLTDGRRGSARSVTREARRRARHAKRVFWAVKDELEGDRRPGEEAQAR